MTDTVDSLGAPIAVNGVRPVWLRNEDCYAIENSPGRWLSYRDGELVVTNRWSWGEAANGGRGFPIAIRLPADHFAYRALDAGFEPWGGGDTAPADWDGGDVLWATGTIGHAGDWRHEGFYGASIIIGYRKKAEFGKVHTDGSRSGGQPAPIDWTKPLAAADDGGEIALLESGVEAHGHRDLFKLCRAEYVGGRNQHRVEFHRTRDNQHVGGNPGSAVRVVNAPQPAAKQPQGEKPKTLRDEFAMAALAALASRYEVSEAARQAYAYADAMMAEREKVS